MIKALTRNTFQTELTNGKHHILADEPISANGTDLGLKPQELLEASLASCTSITIRMYLNLKAWAVSEIHVNVTTILNLDTQEKSLRKEIEIHGNIDKKQLAQILLVASKCPIHILLEKNITITSSISII